MENQRFDIHDDDPSTEGGPPGWVAYAIVALAFLAAAAISLSAFAIYWSW